MRSDVDAPSRMRPDMDLVTFEVLRHALVNVTEEMALTIRRVAYSTNIKTRADFSCAFFDADLRCVAQSFAQPAHLVAMATIVPNTIRQLGISSLRQGDSFLVNDPHKGSSHLNDITCITPVFHSGGIVGFLANMAHHVDVGGSTPASLGLNKELCQEGVVLPGTMIARNGKIDANVFDFFLANIRAPRETAGDLRAQFSANIVGARRVAELLQRYGSKVFSKFCDELITYTARWTEREIRSLPEGVYRAEGYRDDDGFSDEPIKLCTAVVIRDGRMSLDVSGSSLQRRSSLNCTRVMAACGLAFIAKSLIHKDIPVNSGFLSRLSVTGPDGLVCTALRPAAVYGGWEITLKLTELSWLALHPALPGRVAACGKGIMLNVGFGGINPRNGEYYCYMESIGGGGGARPTKDGCSAVQTNIHNTENAPVEEVEMHYPVRIGRYELIPDSCGTGTYRGGLGVRRDFIFPVADCTFTILSDGRIYRPWGLAGGTEASASRFVLDPDGEARELPSKITIEIPKGGCVSIQTPGGGGYGPPADRDSGMVRADVRDGKMSTRMANEFHKGAL